MFIFISENTLFSKMKVLLFESFQNFENYHLLGSKIQVRNIIVKICHHNEPDYPVSNQQLELISI